MSYGPDGQYYSSGMPPFRVTARSNLSAFYQHSGEYLTLAEAVARADYLVFERGLAAAKVEERLGPATEGCRRPHELRYLNDPLEQLLSATDMVVRPGLRSRPSSLAERMGAILSL